MFTFSNRQASFKAYHRKERMSADGSAELRNLLSRGDEDEEEEEEGDEDEKEQRQKKSNIRRAKRYEEQERSIMESLSEI